MTGPGMVAWCFWADTASHLQSCENQSDGEIQLSDSIGGVPGPSLWQAVFFKDRHSISHPNCPQVVTLLLSSQTQSQSLHLPSA